MNFKNIKDKLVDPRYTGGLAALFLLISFADVFFVTDATTVFEMTVWGKISFYGFMITLGWMTLTLLVMPLFYKFISLFKKK